MAYLTVETSVRTHRKFLAAGPAAAWLWICGLGYCQDGLTDGFIPETALGFLGVMDPTPLVRTLVEQRLWEPVTGGWRVHDYLEHNKSADEVRELMRKRALGGHKGGRPRKASRRTSKGNLEGSAVETSKVSAEQNLARNPVLPVLPVLPVRPTDRDDRDGSRADARASRGYGAGVMAGSLPRDHLRHAWCSDRVCVPEFLHGQLVGQVGGAREAADVWLRTTWYPSVIARQTGLIGLEPVKFWQRAFAADHPPTDATLETRLAKASAAFLAGEASS